MTAAVETMAYVGEVPWHGLGNKVRHDISPRKMAEAAGIDWTVSIRPVYVPDDAGNNTIQAPFNAIVRDSDGSVFGPAGPKYTPVQNVDALDFFKKFTKAGHMKMETAGSLNDGRMVWGLAKCNEGFKLPGNDEVEGYLLLTSPHVWGESLKMMFTPIRVVCQNTLTMALNSAGHKFSHTHVSEFDDKAKAKAEQVLGITDILMGQFEETANILAGTSVTKKDNIYFAAKLFAPRAIIDDDERDVDMSLMTPTAANMVRLIDAQPGAHMKSSKGTAWGLFNAVTYYYDHEYGRSNDSRLQSAWFGPNKRLKDNALAAALQFVA